MITIIFNLFLFCFAFWLISPKLSKGLHQTQTLATNHKNVPGQSLHVSPFWSTKSLQGELRHFLLCAGCSGLVYISPDNLRQSTAQLSWFKTVCPGAEGTQLWSFARSLRPLRGVALLLLQSVRTGEGSALRWVNKTGRVGVGQGWAWPSLLI